MEKSITDANKSISVARSFMQREVLQTALLAPKQGVEIEVSKKNIMSVEVPVFESKMRTENPYDVFSYGFAFTNSELDDGILKLSESLSDILKLCEKENAIKVMAEEIEKTRRRVNALEHVMIPDLQQNIRFISMKLDENERSNQARLMKVKDMMIQEQLELK